MTTTEEAKEKIALSFLEEMAELSPQEQEQRIRQLRNSLQGAVNMMREHAAKADEMRGANPHLAQQWEDRAAKKADRVLDLYLKLTLAMGLDEFIEKVEEDRNA